MTEGRDCQALQAVAAEVALGTLEGTERGEALAHLAGCSDCRAHVQDLTEVVDRLLAVAPEAEPPAGFESAVIARIGAERGAAVTHLPRTRRYVLAAAAVVLVLGGLGTGLLVGRDPGGEGPELASAPMKDPAGETVGEVWRYGDDDAVLFVAVPAWSDVAFAGPEAPKYSLRLELVDGVDDRGRCLRPRWGPELLGDRHRRRGRGHRRGVGRGRRRPRLVHRSLP